MSQPVWASGVPPIEDPILGALGTVDSLLPEIQHQSDPARRAVAIRSLAALHAAAPRSGSSTERAGETLASIARDGAQPDVVREAALLALPFVSMDQTLATVPDLMRDPMLRSPWVALLEVILFLEKREAAMPTACKVSDSLSRLRTLLTGRVIEVVADLDTSEDVRSRGQRVLLSDRERFNAP